MTCPKFRMLSLALALCLLLASGAALAELSPVGTLPLSEETIELSVGVAQSAVVEDWHTNKQTRKIEEACNVKLTFVELPGTPADLIQKVELMIMAGGDELPDVIMHGLGGLSNLVRYGQMGMILPLNDYFENLTFFMDQTIANCAMDKQEMLKYITCHDGNIYSMFYLLESLNNSYSTCRIMVYEPWMTELGLEMPQTTDELLTVLRAIRDGDPNGNGEADEIPLMTDRDGMTGTLLRPLMNPFVYTQVNYYIYDEATATIGFAPTQDGWREGLTYIKGLIDEGLLSPLSLTQDGAQLTAIMSQEPTVVGAIGRVSASNLGATDARRGQYIIVDPLEGPSGLRQSTLTPQVPSPAMVITKNCQQPEAAFRMGDYMCSEELSIWQRWGEEGVDWVRPAEGAVGMFASIGYDAIIQPITNWGVLQNTWWAQVGPFVVDSRWAVGQALSENAAFDHTVPIGRTIGKTIEFANQHPIVGLVFDEAEQEVVNEFMTTINDYVNESVARFVTGELSLADNWDDYVAEFPKMGLDAYMEAVNNAYRRMNG